MQRNGGLDSATNYLEALQIDNLSYVYNNNQLQKVSDASGNTQGFNDGANLAIEYTYDANGNMVKDLNKGIGTSTVNGITYNHLNLPTKIIFNNDATKKIEYLYNAVGKKLKKTVTANSTSVFTTDYLDGFQYFGGVLNFFSHAEGYVKNTVVNNLNNYNYAFNYTDHLGNIRLSYGLNASNVLTIIEENHYYPFGLKHSNYNTELYNFAKMANNIVDLSRAAPIDPGNIIDVAPFKNYDIKFGSKEWQDELSLNVYDFGFRQYMPDIGRWTQIDPLSEKIYDLTPYNYVQNSPLSRFDPDGLTDFTLNRKTGEVKQVGEKNDEPDRILRTNSKGEVKKKGEGFLGFLVSKSERGKAKVDVQGIEQGILRDGQNFKTDNNLISVGGKGQPSREGVEKFALQLSNYVGTEIGGTYFSKDNFNNITHIGIGGYFGNSYTESKNNGASSPRNVSSTLDEFKSYQIKGFFHTHPNEPSRFNPSTADRTSRNDALKQNPNLFFLIITHPENGGKYPTNVDYTKY